mgnify:FL=1
MTDKHAQQVLEYIQKAIPSAKVFPRTKRQRGFNEGLDHALEIVQRYIKDFESLEKDGYPL